MPEIVDYFWWSKLNDLWILDRHYVQSDPIACCRRRSAGSAGCWRTATP